jgi:hypothetical protein
MRPEPTQEFKFLMLLNGTVAHAADLRSARAIYPHSGSAPSR